MRKTSKTTTKATADTGYKGHKPGSRIGQLHECFDTKGEDAARKLGEKLELAPATLGIQFSRFKKKK